MGITSPLDYLERNFMKESGSLDHSVEEIPGRNLMKGSGSLDHPVSENPGRIPMEGRQLRPSWRGPFVISGYGGEHGKSYLIRQICGTPIPRTFHGNHLKKFRLREEYLVSGREHSLPVYQNIRYGTGNHKLPRDLRTIPGAHSTQH
jgi:hypothetical protein